MLAVNASAKITPNPVPTARRTCGTPTVIAIKYLATVLVDPERGVLSQRAYNGL